MSKTILRAWISVCVFIGVVFGMLLAMALVGVCDRSNRLLLSCLW